MTLLAMTEGEVWTLIIIILLVLFFGVLVITDDSDWFD